jgi:hypothetical protein
MQDGGGRRARQGVARNRSCRTWILFKISLSDWNPHAFQLVVPAKAGAQCLRGREHRWMMRRFPWRPLRAIGYADVRFGLLLARACFRRNDASWMCWRYRSGYLPVAGGFSLVLAFVASLLACGGLSGACRRPSHFSLLAHATAGSGGERRSRPEGRRAEPVPDLIRECPESREVTKRNGLFESADPTSLDA